MNHEHESDISTRFPPWIWRCSGTSSIRCFSQPSHGSYRNRAALATTASAAPLRMACLYVPNGVNVAKWRPPRNHFRLQDGRLLRGNGKTPQGFSSFHRLRAKQCKCRRRWCRRPRQGKRRFTHQHAPKENRRIRHQAGSFHRSNRGESGCRSDAVRFPRAFHQWCPQIREMRFRLLLCLPIQPFMALGNPAHDPGIKPTCCLRAPFRCRGYQRARRFLRATPRFQEIHAGFHQPRCQGAASLSRSHRPTQTR